MAQKKFVNPYNFIPLSDKAPDRGPVKTGNLMGVIKYSMLTRTPLIIPNTSNSEAFDVRDQNGKPVNDHKSYDFFSYDDLSDKANLTAKGTREGKYSAPVIPGSEVRGMLRNYYEILTNSCMSFVDDDDVLSKRTSEVFSPGLLERKEDGTFILHSAEDCLLRMKDTDSTKIYNAEEKAEFGVKSYKNSKLKEGQKVYVGIVERGRRVKPVVDELLLEDDGEAEIGYVIKGEPGPKMRYADKEKHNCHIFIESGVVRELKKNESGTLTTVLTIYKDNKASEYNEYRGAWNKFKSGNGEDLFPVYYSRFNKDADIMLSPASITREIYTVKLRKILRDHCSCTEEDELCPACALFGMLGKKFNVTSRIRVADLTLSEASLDKYNSDPRSVFEKEITLKTLNSPKINNMEFYIKRPAADAWFWTYDYYVDDKGVAHAYLPEINGRKFYWHQPEMKREEADPDAMNNTVRPLRDGVEFEGKVYFDHLTKEELQTLVYALNAGDEGALADKNQCYKLGHGKPLGYGSVAVHVDSVKLKKVRLDEDGATVKYSTEGYAAEKPEIDPEIEKHFATMTDFGLLKGKDVHYPMPDEPDKEGNYPIFGWFVKNHSGYKRDKRDRDKIEVINMPNSRLQMTYIEHMYALEPELRRTNAPVKAGSGTYTDRNAGKPRPNNGENNQAGKKNNFAGGYKNNSKSNKPVVEVTVESVWRSNGTIEFTVNGLRSRVYGDKLNGRTYKVGDTVKVRLIRDDLSDKKGRYALYKLAE